jgi:ketosteroid isomerase-like protein
VTGAASVEQAIEGFLAAFRNLEWGTFLGAFAQDASVFFPFPEQPRLAMGKPAIAGIFEPYFATVRQRHPAGPPYLTLIPVDSSISVHGEAALVTFSLVDPDRIGRRSLFMVRQNGAWLIQHLHASNM